ncbi:MAG TPA: phosphatase PAP2 family protein [Bacteroidales bacterium]|nr:phosphatase PAP2 family protein [Bacteroidales bacterium]
MIEWLEHIDRIIFLWINGLHSPLFDTFFYYITKFYISIPVYFVIIYLLYKKFSPSYASLLLGIMILAVISADAISVAWFKEVFLRYRPSHNTEIQDMIHIVKNYRGGTYGFVSSHAANTFAFALFSGLVFRTKRILIPLFIWAGLVSYSRIYLGVHYPADIVCGALVGMCIAFVYYKIFTILHIRFSTSKNL